VKKVCITDYTEYRRVTDRRTDRHISCHGIVCAMHTRRVVKIKKIQTTLCQGKQQNLILYKSYN